MVRRIVAATNGRRNQRGNGDDGLATSTPRLFSIMIAFSLGLTVSHLFHSVQDSSSIWWPSSTSDDAPTSHGNVVVSNKMNRDDPYAGFACKGFFTIMISAFIESDTKPGLCSTLFNGRYRPLLEAHSAHFLRMNETLTVFTTWTDEQLAEPRCHLDDLPGLKMQQVNVTALLLKHGWTEEMITWMQAWETGGAMGRGKMSLAENHHRISARYADVWRVVLAKEYQMAYGELDMVYLIPHADVYLKEPNVAAPVYSEVAAVYEIQNSGFCFLPVQLDVLVRMQRDMILERGPEQMTTEKYPLYTALGPNLLQHAVQEIMFHGPVRLYPTGCNDDSSFAKLMRKSRTPYRFMWLHLDGRFRGGNIANLAQIIKDFREQMNPPTRDEVFPATGVEAFPYNKNE